MYFRLCYELNECIRFKVVALICYIVVLIVTYSFSFTFDELMSKYLKTQPKYLKTQKLWFLYI